MRELKEELGAKVNPSEVISLGAIMKAITKYSELIYVYFWHDKHDTITGFYECEAKYFNNCKEAMAYPKIMDDVKWLLSKRQDLQLLA